MRATLLPLLTLVLGLAVLVDAGAESPPPSPLTFDQVFSPERPGRWPGKIAWHPDGKRLSFTLPEDASAGAGASEGGAEAVALWSFDAESAASEKVLSESLIPDGKLDAYTWSPQGDRLLLLSSDRIFLYSPAEPGLRLAGKLHSREGSAHFSPDGSRLAYARDANLYVLDLASGKERTLTKDGKPDAVLNGTTDWVYWEEIWGRNAQALWWSPDGKKIAYYRFDESPVESYPLVDELATYPTVTWQKYPKAGQANPKVEIRVADVASGKSVRLDTGRGDDYLCRVHWLASGKVAVERLNRDQTRLDLLVCDPAKGSCNVLMSEESKSWVNLGDDRRFLSDGRFIWGSDRSGFRHLYLYDALGQVIRALTAGTWSVTSLDAVDEKEGLFYFTGFSSTGNGGLHRRVFRAKLDGTAATPLTAEQGWNQASFAPDAKLWLHTASTANTAPRRTVARADGTRLKTLPAGPDPAIDPSTLPAWDFAIIWALDGTRLPARILKPVPFDPGRRYPAIVYHYGGPGSQVVANQWEGRSRDLWHRLMAQRGFVIFSVDNPTTAVFGKKGEDLVHRDFGKHNTEGQIAGVEYLKTLPYVDKDRIGLWGWSGGGSNTLIALLTKPGVFKAGVAGAPVTDWKLYDSIWTERYLDLPEGNAGGYEASSPVTLAKNLKDHLLLVHGTADDNVHPQNSTAMAQALIEAGIPFEQAFYPKTTHAIAGKAERHFYERMTEFFERWLKE